jgi:hypothetical protein
VALEVADSDARKQIMAAPIIVAANYLMAAPIIVAANYHL